MSFYKRAGQAASLILCSHFLTACIDVNMDVHVTAEKDSEPTAANIEPSSAAGCPKEDIIPDLIEFLDRNNESADLVFHREDGSWTTISTEDGVSLDDGGSWSYIEKRPEFDYACLIDHGKGATFAPKTNQAKEPEAIQLIHTTRRKPMLF